MNGKPDACTQCSQPLPSESKARTKMIGVRVSEREHAALRKLAAANGVTISDFVRANVHPWLVNA